MNIQDIITQYNEAEARRVELLGQLFDAVVTLPASGRKTIAFDSGLWCQWPTDKRECELLRARQVRGNFITGTEGL